jgi:hypothetical protein
MQVKCLTVATKDQIVADYTAKMPLVEIAKKYETSPRTVGRVLEERGLATPVPRLKGEAYWAVKLMEEHGLALDELRTIVEDHFDGRTREIAVKEYLASLQPIELARLFQDTLSESIQNCVQGLVNAPTVPASDPDGDIPLDFHTHNINDIPQGIPFLDWDEIACEPTTTEPSLGPVPALISTLCERTGQGNDETYRTAA